MRPSIARELGSVAAPATTADAASRAGGRRDAARGAGRDRPRSQPAHPYRERALALWPGLDRARLRRCGDDHGKIARLVAHTTCESADVIEAMLSAPFERQVVMPPVRRPSPIPIDPYVVLLTPPAVAEADGDEEESPVTAPPPRRTVTAHDIPWVAASGFAGRNGDGAGSA